MLTWKNENNNITIKQKKEKLMHKKLKSDCYKY